MNACGGNTYNAKPVLNIEPQVIGEVKNGKAWLMKEDDSFVYIVKVSGTPYEMGYAQGQLLGKEI